jgi:2-hydroxycyclohexanecarboxyl-CoA dehydrogenase
MNLDLNGKVALVTGGGMGVGREICKRLAAEGVKVAVNDILPERVNAVVGEIEAAGGVAAPMVCDITDLEAVKAGVAAVAAQLGPVDILVNNAGVVPERRTGEIGRPTFLEMEPRFWNKIVDLNYYGVMNCVAAVGPSMVERRYGKILSMVSDAGRVGEARMAVYSGAKAAIIGFTKAIAKEMGPHRINVNTVSLSAVSHENPIAGFQKPGTTAATDETLRKVLKNYPVGEGLGRLTTVQDAADAVLFLVSERSAYITGQCLGVNGGFAIV